MIHSARFLIPAIAIAWFAAAPLHSTASEFQLKVVDKEAPKELSQSFRDVLQAKAVQLLQGDKPVYEFWFVSKLQLKSKPESLRYHLDALAPTTVIGALAATRSERDYRDDELYEGIYTMRFSLQPQDGNHLGTAEYPYFAVLIPANLDTTIDGIKSYKQMVKASSKETATDHPIILSLRPAASADGNLPKLNEPAEHHESVRVKLPASVDGEDTEVVFEIVVKGKAEV